MLVFRKENLVFLAVPKTGTTALEGALAPRASIVVREPADLKHAPCYRFQRFIQPFLRVADVGELEMMAIIREPVDWLGSWYRYRQRDDLDGTPRSTKGISFDDFVLEYCRGKPAPFAAVGSQAKFVSDKDGELGVRYLFRYDAQKRINHFLTERLGPFPTPKRLNTSPAMDLSLSSDVLDKLKRKREEEFAIWEVAKS